MSDLDFENKQLRKQLQALTTQAANNEKILRRSQQRELELLNAGSLVDLINHLVIGLKASFGLDQVTLILHDPQYEIQHLLLSNSINPSALVGVNFVEDMLSLSPVYANLRTTCLGPYRRSQHQLILPASIKLHSVAILPLLRQGRLVGSLNFASADGTRFTASHGSDFLNHLAAIAAFSLENIVNREKLVRTGLTDVLTGWYNRRYLQTRIREEIRLGQRHGYPLCCLMMDIDNFKLINDNYGHLAGDILLREVTRRLKIQIRSSDVPARFGGDEFAVLMPQTQLEEGIHLAERMLRAVAAKPIAVDRECVLTTTISIGAAEHPAKSSDKNVDILSDNLLTQADRALYQAKSAGRNCVRSIRM